MSFSKGDYDRGINTFSPEGRIFQVEYAIEAIKLGSTAIGITTADESSTVIVVEKRLKSSLIIPSSIEKIYKIDSHIGAAMSGLTADARILCEHARAHCANHEFTYNEAVSVDSCVNAIADMALDFSDNANDEDDENEEEKKKTMGRPLGVSLLVCGYDHKMKKTQLYHTDPSGTFTEYKAIAIGSASENANLLLSEKYIVDDYGRPTASLEFENVLEMALTVLREVMEEKISPTNVEVGVISNTDKKFKILSVGEVTALINKLPESIH